MERLGVATCLVYEIVPSRAWKSSLICVWIRRELYIRTLIFNFKWCLQYQSAVPIFAVSVHIGNSRTSICLCIHPRLSPEQNVHTVLLLERKPGILFLILLFPSWVCIQVTLFIRSFFIKLKYSESGDVFYTDVVKLVLKVTRRKDSVSRNLETSSANNHLDITNCSSNCSSNIFSSIALNEKSLLIKEQKNGKAEWFKAIRTRIEKTKRKKE